MKITLIYTTIATPEQAETIASQLVSEKLVACVNIFAPHTAIYEWQSKIEKQQEVAMLLKTTANATEKAMARLKTLHPYETPCILAIAPSQVDEVFAKWVQQSVAD